MTEDISQPVMDRIRKAIDHKMALHFPEERWKNLQRRLLPAAKDLGFDDLESLVRSLEMPDLSIPEIEVLASYLTVGETYFWREPQSFAALEQKILPEIIRKREQGEKRIRIWSAGCSSGEEAYSLAIVLKKNIRDIRDWNVSILATDINSEVLRSAKTGVYGRNSFRNAPKWLVANYFKERKDGKWEVVSEIKKMVTIKHLNLAGDVFPSVLNNTNAQDIIFCRNVLMYFRKERAKEIISKLSNCLVDEGFLIVGLSELSQELFSKFDRVCVSDTTLYQKNRVPRINHPEKDRREETTWNPSLAALQDTENGFNTVLFPDGKKEETALTRDRLEQPIGKTEPADTIGKEREPDHHRSGTEDEVAQIKMLADQGDLKNAISECEKAILTNKVEPRLRFLLASILQEVGEWDKAVESLNAAKYLDPDFVLAYYSLANIYVQRGNMKQAKKGFENALTLLKNYKPDEIIPEAEGLTAGRIQEIIQSTLKLRQLL